MCNDLSAIEELAAFLRKFPKLQKATINFTMSVCLSVYPYSRNTLAPKGRMFMKFYI